MIAAEEMIDKAKDPGGVKTAPKRYTGRRRKGP